MANVLPGAVQTPPGVEAKLLSRAVADWIADRVLSGEFAPGTRLHETRLAESAGVSRSPIREALRILAGEGLVEIEPRYGAHVARVDASDASHLYACRLLLGPVCVRQAVEALADTDLPPLNELRAAMQDAVEADEPSRTGPTRCATAAT